jgi:hypothetical protein
MTATRKGALIKVGGQVLFGAWAAALTLLFLLTQTPTVLRDLVVKRPELVVLNQWRTTLMAQLSASYKQ